MICAACEEWIGNEGDCVESLTSGLLWHVLCAPPVEGEDVREFHPGLLFVHPAGLTARDRARAIHVEHEMGRTYAEIGPDVGLSYQRARQLSRRYRRAA